MDGRRAILGLVLLLGGCATVSAFVPYSVEVTDRAAFDSDLAACRAYAEAYPKRLDGSAIAQAAGDGAAQNATGAAVSPWVPAIGALGGATQATLDGLGLMNSQAVKIVVRCLSQKGLRSGKYLVIDPN